MKTEHLRLCCFVFNLAGIKNGTPEDDDLEGLALEIPQHWKKLARRLEFKVSAIDSIDKKKEEHTEKAYKMLLNWKQAKGKGATFPVLYDALSHPYVGRRDLAEEFCCVP